MNDSPTLAHGLPDAHVGTALVRRPSPRLAEGIVTHLDRSPIDVDLAMRQWETYVDTLRDHGWRVIEAPPAEDCPDAAFIEDTLVVVGDVAIATRPGAEARRAEVDGAARAAADAGLRVVSIEDPGTLDGGDILKIGTTMYVGRGGRTDDAGIEQLAGHVMQLGFSVIPVPVTQVLHLKSAVTALPDGTVVGYEPLVDDVAVFDRFVGVPEESGSHVVLLGGDRVLMAANAPASARMFTERGLTPVCVDISEFEKLEGCVTCLSVRVRPTS